MPGARYESQSPAHLREWRRARTHVRVDPSCPDTTGAGVVVHHRQGTALRHPPAVPFQQRAPAMRAAVPRGVPSRGWPRDRGHRDHGRHRLADRDPSRRSCRHLPRGVPRNALVQLGAAGKRCPRGHTIDRDRALRLRVPGRPVAPFLRLLGRGRARGLDAADRDPNHRGGGRVDSERSA